MNAMASQITSVSAVYSTVCSGTDQKKNQSFTSLAFVRGIHRWPVYSITQRDNNAENVYSWWRHHESVIVKIPDPIWNQIHDTTWRHQATMGHSFPLFTDFTILTMTIVNYHPSLAKSNMAEDGRQPVNTCLCHQKKQKDITLFRKNAYEGSCLRIEFHLIASVSSLFSL